MAIIAAAAGLAVSVPVASAQVWNNAAGGNWNVAGNWTPAAVPASANTTQLTFNANGNTYTATNDVANPFLLNLMTLNNTGAGQINIAGQALSFGGTAPGISQTGSGAAAVSNAITIQSTGLNSDVMTIGGTGAGNLALSGALTGASAGTAGGGALLMDNPNSTTTLSGGGTLYSLRVSKGGVVLNGGTWNLLSTQRENDIPVGGLNNGFWSLDVGGAPSPSGVSRFTMIGGNMTASMGFIAVANGSTSVATFSNGAVATFDPTGAGGRFGVNAGSGTINILSGAQVHARLIEGGRQGNTQTVGINVDGANTVLDGGQLVLPRVTGSAFMNITGGAHVNLISTGGSNGNSFIGTGADPAVVAPNPPVPVPNTALVTVSGAGSQFNVLGQQSVGTTGTATLLFNNGAVGNSSTMFMASNNQGVGVWTMDGANTVYTINNVAVLSGGGQTAVGDQLPAGTSTVNVTNGAQLHGNRFTFGQNFDGQTNVNISGTGSRIDTAAGAGTGSWAMAAGENSSAATFNVSNGAVASAPTGAFFFSGGITAINGGTTVFNLTNATANVGFNQISNSPGSVGTMNVNAGGVVNCGTSMLLGLAANTTSGLNVGGAGAIVNTPVLDIGFGGSTTLGDPLPGGSNFGNVTNGGQVNTTGLGVTVSDSIDTFGTLVVTGTNSKITSTGTAQLVVASSDNAIGTMSVAAGAVVSMGGNAFFSADTNTVARVTVNAGSLLMGGNITIAGNGSLNTGQGTLTATNGGVVTSNGMSVFTNGTFIVGTGTSAARYTGGINGVGVDGNILYNAGSFSTTGTLGVAGNVLLSSAARNGAGTPSNKKMLEVGQATLTTSGVIDLNDNDMLIHDGTAGARQKYENFVKVARNSGLWNMPGITSTAAKNSVPKNKNLGVLSGTEYLAVNGTPFNGKTVLAGDTVIKFTFNGDTDFNGVVNFDDYARADSGFNNTRSGWLNGDFDYNGVVNFDDYALIDQAFNTQGAVILSSGQGELAGPGMDRQIVSVGLNGGVMIATDDSMMLRPTNGPDVALTLQGNGLAGGGNLQAVPEPATIGLVGVGLLGALRRRRRHA